MINFWNTILNVALLGTSKKQLISNDLPTSLANILPQLQTNDNEDTFLKTASIAMAYRQAGTMPLRVESTDFKPCEAESLPYCSEQAAGLLQIVLTDSNLPLIELFLRRCAAKNQIVPPSLLPQLLDLMQKSTSNELQNLSMQCGGNRAKWLCQLNKDWNLPQYSAVELFENGTTEQRKNAFSFLRKQNPSQAVALLQSVWKEESAATKVEFIKLLENELCENDVEFLESLEKEKSQKVKEEVINLLLKLPNSKAIQRYIEFIKQSVSIKRTKTLGLIPKTTLDIKIPTPEDDFFKLGVEKTSENKKIKDQEFWLQQVLTKVPLKFLESYLESNAEEIIALFKKDSEYMKYVKSFADAAYEQRNTEWATAFLNGNDARYINLIDVLPEKARHNFMVLLFKIHPQRIIEFAKKDTNEWSLILTRSIFTYTAIETYTYDKKFYAENILLIPAEIAHELENFSPKEDYKKSYWKTTSEEIKRLLNLKMEILKMV